MTDRAALIQALQDAAVGREVACADAHEIAAQFGLTPQELGETVNNATDLRFFRCQLGLFGYGLKSEGKSKIVLKAAHVPEEIAADLQARAAEGQISCADVWMVAARHKYPRLGIGNIVEALGLRVRPCQIGCF